MNLNILQKQITFLHSYSDLNLCLLYQVTDHEVYYNEMIRRYQNSIAAQTKGIYDIPTISAKEEWDDIYIEVLNIFQKTMKRVNPNKITEITKFRFNVMFQTAVRGYKSNLYRTSQTKKAKSITIQYTGKEAHYYKYTRAEKSEENKFMEKYILSLYMQHLDPLEQTFIKHLKCGLTTRQIGAMLSIDNPYKFRKRLLKKYQKIALKH